MNEEKLHSMAVCINEYEMHINAKNSGALTVEFRYNSGNVKNSGIRVFKRWLK